MKHVLILEDEPFIAIDLKYAFEDAGAMATTATCCAEAIFTINTENISAAVLDVSLGAGETCEAAAAELRKRNIPFVLHTGDLNRVGENLRAIDAPVFAKPTSSEDIVVHVMKMVPSPAP